MLADNKLSKKSQIKQGQKIKIVKSGAAAAPVASDEEAVAAAAPPVEAPSKEIEHVVAKGDTLGTISKRYGVSIAQLEQWNGLEKGETIRIDQKIAVKAAGKSASPTQLAAAAPARTAEPSKSTVTVAAGDTPSKIASKNGVTTKELLAWNNLTEKSTIQVGQKLVVMGKGIAASSEAEASAEPLRMAKAETKAPAKTAASKASPKSTHTVAAGQTPTSIAKQYGVGVTELFKWNNWDKGHVIRPGDKVLVENK